MIKYASILCSNGKSRLCTAYFYCMWRTMIMVCLLQMSTDQNKIMDITDYYCSCKNGRKKQLILNHIMLRILTKISALNINTQTLKRHKFSYQIWLYLIHGTHKIQNFTDKKKYQDFCLCHKSLLNIHTYCTKNVALHINIPITRAQ